MEDFKPSEKVIQSYLFTEFGEFFVSTCYRRSSAMLNTDSWYYETFAWRLNEANEQTDWVADNSGASYLKKGLEQHNEVCKQLQTTGEYVELS